MGNEWLAISPLLRQRVAWSRRDQWLPLFRRLGTPPMPWKDKCKPSLRQLSSSPSAVKSWSSNWTRGMNNVSIANVTNGTMKSEMTASPWWEIGKEWKTRKKVTSPVGMTDRRTWTVHLSWRMARCAWHRTFTWWWTSLMDWLTLHSVSHLLPPSSQVPNAASRSVQQIKGSTWPFRIIPDPNPSARGSGQNHVQSVPHYAQGTRKNVVQ